MLLWTAYDMAITVFGVKRLGLLQSVTLGWDKLFIVAVSFAVLTLTEINPALVVLVAAAAGGVVYR